MVAGCSSEAPSGPSRAGSVSLSTVDLSGSVESFRIDGPPGEVIIGLTDQNGHCTFSVNAAQPKSGDLTAAAQASRVQLLLNAAEDQLSDLFAGRAQILTAHAGQVFTNESTLRLRRNRSQTQMDEWY